MIHDFMNTKNKPQKETNNFWDKFKRKVLNILKELGCVRFLYSIIALNSTYEAMLNKSKVITG